MSAKKITKVENGDLKDFEPNIDFMTRLLEVDDGSGESIALNIKWGYEDYDINGYLLSKESDYGGEGQGDDYWVVVRCQKDDHLSYWKFYGWYASYDGGYLENVTQVQPKQQLVTIYE